MGAADFRIFTEATAQRIAQALEGMAPGLATENQRGFMAPAPYIHGGLIDDASSESKGLMSKTMAEAVLNLISDPSSFLWAAGSTNKGAGFHNSFYRGKYLGDSLTEAQSATILLGEFDDLFIGDYWTINGVDWVIADFDPFYRTGDTELLTHHVAVIPRDNLYTTAWHSGSVPSNGYIGSAIRSNIKAASASAAGAQAKVIAAFGDSHVISYRALYPNAYSSGNATSWAWVDARVELMNENEVYGAQAWSTGGKGHEVGTSKRQLSIFRLKPDFATIRAYWWLRSVTSSADAAYVDGYGYATAASVAYVLGVRPLSLIA